VDELSGDFRANLTPIQVAACNGSTGQLWDIITAGKHDDQAGTILVVNTLTQACLNFDPRRAAGNQVLLFSCGGRADGGGAVTNSQLFSFPGGSGPLAFTPLNAVGTCLTATSSNVLDQTSCNSADVNQSFTLGGSSSAASVTEAPVGASPSTTALVVAQALTSSTPAACVSTTTVTVTTVITSISPLSVAQSEASAALPTSSASLPTSSAALPTSSAAVSVPAVSAALVSDAGANPTTPVPVSRAGGVLQPSSAAESNPRDNTAVRAFSSASIKAANGQCLFIDPTAGDFRQNLIPVQLQDCTGSAGEKFDLITSGIHNNAANSTLVVSSLTQGCLNFDPRRAAGDTVILFSCGGRADGSGQVTSSQLFPFTTGETSLALSPENTNGATCLVPLSGRLDQASCDGDAGQLFNIVP